MDVSSGVRCRIPRLSLFLILCACLPAACDTSVDPILESNRRFSMYGTLDMNRDTQYVRVVPIRETLDSEGTAEPTVEFRSTDLNSGKVIVWKDSVVSFRNGTVGHVYYAPLRLEGGHTYRLEVHTTGSDVVTYAETNVPDYPRAIVQPEVVTGTPGGISVAGSQVVLWEHVPKKPFRVDVWYRFYSSERSPFFDVRLPYEPEQGRLGDSWRVQMDLRKDRFALDTLVAVSLTPLFGIGMTITVLDDQFVPPGGVFDPEVLAQPGTFNNVENGFGFIGSVGRFSAEWILSNDAMERLQYLTPKKAGLAQPPSHAAR